MFRIQKKVILYSIDSFIALPKSGPKPNISNQGVYIVHFDYPPPHLWVHFFPNVHRFGGRGDSVTQKIKAPYLLKFSPLFFYPIFIFPPKSLFLIFSSGHFPTHIFLIQGWRSGFWPKTGYTALYLKRREIFKVYWINVLDNFNSLLFCFNTFGVRRTIDILDSENQPGL